MKIISKNVRPFPIFNKLHHARNGKIVAQFLYEHRGRGDIWYHFSDLRINLYLNPLKRRIKSFEEKGWPTIQEKVALLRFKELGLE